MNLFANLKRLFSAEQPTPQHEDPLTLRVALLLEAATFDEHFAPEEDRCIRRLLHDGYGLSESETEEVFRLARVKRLESPDVFAITRGVNQLLTPAQKEVLMREIWQVLYADGHISPEEDVLAGRLKNLLRLDTSVWQKTKLEAKKNRD